MGFFSIAIWDRKNRTLYLIRDPIGVKPLVYANVGNRLAFGSESKAILETGLVDVALDPVALHLSMNVRLYPGR